MNLRSKPSSAEPVNILKDPTRPQFLTSSRCNPHPTRPTSLRSRKRGLRTSHQQSQTPLYRLRRRPNHSLRRSRALQLVGRRPNRPGNSRGDQAPPTSRAERLRILKHRGGPLRQQLSRRAIDRFMKLEHHHCRSRHAPAAVPELDVCAMNASTSLMKYDWISKRRFWLSCAVSPVFLVVGCAFLFMAHTGWQLAGGAVFILGLFLLIQKQTIFDRPRGLLRAVHRALGFFPIWQRTLRLDEFDAIVVERRETYHPAQPRAESEDFDINWRVGLRRKVGRPYWVCCDSAKHGQPHVRVEEFARRLSSDTGLEIIETEV